MSAGSHRDHPGDPAARGAPGATGDSVVDATRTGLASESRAGAPRRFRVASAVALAVAVLSLAVYLATAAPTVMFGDSGELQTVALLGGIGHPSGYPTFIMLGQVFGRLVPGDPAHRITVMSAVFGGVGVLAFGLLLAELELSTAGVLAGALVFAASFTVWWSAIRSEVYTLAIACFLLGLGAALRALRRGRNRDAIVASFLLGLTLTTHMAYAPAVLAVLGMLAWRTGPWRERGLSGWAGMAVGFAVGLLPILYLVYTDPRTEATNYLKYTVDLQAHQFGLTPETFRTPWQRISWLALGREVSLGDHLASPRHLVRNSLDMLAHTFLFEVGPLALVPFAIMLKSRLKRPQATDLLLAGIMVLSFCFGVASTDGRMLPVFTLPYGLMVIVFVAIGIDQLIGSVAMWPLPRMLVAVAAFVLIASLPNALRVYASRHPIGPLAWQVLEEGPPRITSFIPRLDQYREPREIGERLLREIPHGAFVAVLWNELAVLKYLQLVEGRRRDLAFDAYYHPWHLQRMRRWQERFDLRERPIVGVGEIPMLRPYLDCADSVSYAQGKYFYVQRTPIRLP